MLRQALSLRYSLGRGVVRDNLMLDSVLLLPLCQKIISLELRDEIAKLNKKPSRFDQFTEALFDRIFGENEQLDKIKKGPLTILESTLRPVLVPNEKWSDVNRWMFHARFVSWARNEYLYTMHSSELHDVFTKFPALRRGPQLSSALRNQMRREVGRDDNQRTIIYRAQNLPSTNTIVKAFGMDGWTGQKNRNATWLQMDTLTKQMDGQLLSVPETSRQIPLIEPDTDLSALSLEDVLELAGAQVANSNAFTLLCEHFKISQLLTKEYVTGLVNYLKKRASGSSVMIIHVGEAELLKNLIIDELNASRRGKKILWKSAMLSASDPEQIRSGIKHFAVGCDQIFIICNSMPAGHDFTKAFRDSGVDEYILVGEADDGSFGHNWQTWGNRSMRGGELEEEDSLSAPFEADSYKRMNIHELDKYQFSFSDCKESANASTVSFRRHDNSKLAI